MQRIAVMQPYFFPYIGYFQLMHAADTFVFLDDVSYIKGGWINRNRILIQGMPAYLTIPCRNISQNIYIRDIQHNLDDKLRDKLLKKVQLAYSKAPFFKDIFGLFSAVIYSDSGSISRLAMKSVESVCAHLGMETALLTSSELDYRRDPDKSLRMVAACETLDASVYLNASGGKKLYNSDSFRNHGIDIRFVDGTCKAYKQYGTDFVPSLSILDVLMFNSVDSVQKMLAEYQLTTS